jgi:maltooligosyltrehalose trehalohydrolase
VSKPFLYFADHHEEVLARSVIKGRKQFLAQFPSHGSAEAQEVAPNPCSPETFEHSKLDVSERTTHAAVYLFHQDLLRLRWEDPLIARQDRERLDGAVLGPEAFVLRFFSDTGEDRLLVVNLGTDLEYVPAPEPLLAPADGGGWRVVWSSDDPAYGGPGVINLCEAEGWRLPGASAVLLAAEKP